MKPLHKILAMGASALMLSGVGLSAATADDSNVIGHANPAACSDVGDHASISKSTPVFMTGSYAKKWLDPGVSYSITKGSSSTISRSVTAGASVEVFKVANLKLDTSLSKSVTVTASDSYTWKNTSKSTKWLQLGARGYKFNWSSYRVIPPCKITNSKSGSATIPTGEEWFRHN